MWTLDWIGGMVGWMVGLWWWWWWWWLLLGQMVEGEGQRRGDRRRGRGDRRRGRGDGYTELGSIDKDLGKLVF
jgi:hypothetical protein